MLQDLLLRNPDKTYVEDVFSTYLYTGNGGTQTITNGLDLLGDGGAVLFKPRTSSTQPFSIYDTVRGVTQELVPSTTAAQTARATGLTAFTSSGFTIGARNEVNSNTTPFGAWSFRRAPKFFDIVTYTGNGANRTINHSLGTTPGMIWIKCTSTTSDWTVWHRSLASTEYILLNGVAAKVASAVTYWDSKAPTSTQFTLGISAAVNTNGATYVAYLFAHDTGTDGLIQCGSFTTGGADKSATVTLGWEPQLILAKAAVGETGQWRLFDTTRGMYAPSTVGQELFLEASSAEAAMGVGRVHISSTGFSVAQWENTLGSTTIYMAIRRGPMRPPTDPTQVLEIVARTGNSTDPTNVGSSVFADFALIKNRSYSGSASAVVGDRVRGTPYLQTAGTAVEVVDTSVVFNATPWATMTGVRVAAGSGGNINLLTNNSNFTYINYMLRRAPKFFDVVTYAGDGVQGRTFTHNLGVTPNFIIIKQRDVTATHWYSWNDTGGGSWWLNYLLFSGATAQSAFGGTVGLAAAPTSTTITLGNSSLINGSGSNYVAYLFGNCGGVQKIGSYTGNGSSIDIDCGFTAGARFVLLRRSSTGGGSWFLFDSVRGITSSTDPYFVTNGTAAEVTSINAVAPLASGFTVIQEATSTNLNISGSTYFYLAIA